MREITKLENSHLLPVKRKRVAAYARVSTNSNAQFHSLSAQISYYNDYIGSRGDWELVRIYADGSMTGTKDDRPEFQQLLNDCRAGKIDTVITKSVTRLARNTVTLLETVRELKNLGVDVYFEKENIHSLSTDGELMLTLLALFAQEESRSASENVKWRIRKKFEQGYPSGGSLLGYRLKNGMLQVIPEEAKIVQMVFADFLSGMGVASIARKLNRLNIPTQRGAPWSKNTIRQMLNQEKYAGDLLLQKTYKSDHINKKKMINHGELPMYYVENSHEAIISKETFALVQQELKRRAEKYAFAKHSDTPYLFTNLIHCRICGKRFSRKLTASGKKYQKKAMWICRTFYDWGKDACPSQRIPESILIEKSLAVLGLESLDRETLLRHISEIQVPEHNHLVYVFHDGHTEDIYWQNPSRRESWTPEMRKQARERQLAIIKERRKINEHTS